MKKKYILFSSGIFLILSVMAYLLYKERILYVDSAYFAFNLINDETPVIEHNRYSFYLLQILPWSMLKSGFTIASILQILSMSHLFIGLIAFVILLRINQKKPAIILALFQVLTYRESFFLALNETSILLASVILLSGYLIHFQSKGQTGMKVFFAYFICLLIAIFSHPMAILLCPFIIIIHYLNKGTFSNQQLRLLIPAGILSLLIKIITSKISTYESELYNQLLNSVELIGNIQNLSSYTFFLGNFDWSGHLFSIYFIPILIILFIGVKYYETKDYKSIAFYISFIVFFWQLIILMFNRGDGNIFMEKNFTPWVFTCIFPLIYVKLKPLKIYFYSYLFIVFYSFWGIYRVSSIYINRYKVLEHLILTQIKTHVTKTIIEESTIDHSVWQATWALPYESLLLCKIKDIPNATIKVYHNEESINKELKRKDIFLGADFYPVFSAKAALNQKYFKLDEVVYKKVDLNKP